MTESEIETMAKSDSWAELQDLLHVLRTCPESEVLAACKKLGRIASGEDEALTPAEALRLMNNELLALHLGAHTHCLLTRGDAAES